MANLVPWKRRREEDVTEFRRELDNLFDRFWGEGFFPTREFLREESLIPRVDVAEGKRTITVKAEIPGVEAQDIDISLDGRLLHIRGEKKQEKEEKEENHLRMERTYGYFQRTVELPSEVDPNEVDAKYKKGVLTVKLKKTRESESKRIQVRAG